MHKNYWTKERLLAKGVYDKSKKEAMFFEQRFKEAAAISPKPGSSDHYEWWKLSHKYFNPDKVSEVFGAALDPSLQIYTFTTDSHLSSWWRDYTWLVQQEFSERLPVYYWRACLDWHKNNYSCRKRKARLKKAIAKAKQEQNKKN